MKSVKLRDCAICGEPVMSKQYQKDSVRTCQPVCARTLAAREHPDLDGRGRSKGYPQRDDDNYVRCAWFDSDDNSKIQGFPPAALKRVVK